MPLRTGRALLSISLPKLKDLILGFHQVMGARKRSLGTGQNENWLLYRNRKIEGGFFIPASSPPRAQLFNLVLSGLLATVQWKKCFCNNLTH